MDYQEMKTVIHKIWQTSEMNPKIDPAYCLENIQDTVQAVGISGGPPELKRPN